MKNTAIILIFLLAGCTSKQHIANNQTSEKNLTLIEISITQGDNLTFIIKNISEESVKIYQPEKLKIEKFIDGSWQKLRILPCPCGAPCARPPEFVDIPSGQSHYFSWNKNESWCGDKNESGIPETKRVIAEPGKYRIVILYSIENGNQEFFYKEFEI